MTITKGRDVIPPLLPCPHCGAEVELRWDEEHGYGGFIACNTFDCAHSNTGKHDKESHIAAWNRRVGGAL
jgi:phage terminase large subunit GpA-like protein